MQRKEGVQHRYRFNCFSSMNANRLKWIFGMVMVALVMLALMTQPNHRPIIKSKLTFKVLESDALFFRNLRQFYYEKEERSDADYELFRHPDQLLFGTNAPRLTIVNNWKHDEAYLVFENADRELFAQTIRMCLGPEKEVYSLASSNAQAQQLLAVSLFEALEKHDSLFEVEEKQRWVPIWENQSERGVVKTILKDYFKLTGSL